MRRTQPPLLHVMLMCFAWYATSAQAQSPAPVDSDLESGAITWEELQELIPDLQSMEVHRVGANTAGHTEIRFCEKRPELGTRIAYERCYTLEQLVRKYCQRTHQRSISQWCFELGG